MFSLSATKAGPVEDGHDSSLTTRRSPRSRTARWLVEPASLTASGRRAGSWISSEEAVRVCLQIVDAALPPRFEPPRCIPGKPPGTGRDRGEQTLDSFLTSLLLLLLPPPSDLACRPDTRTLAATARGSSIVQAHRTGHRVPSTTILSRQGVPSKVALSGHGVPSRLAFGTTLRGHLVPSRASSLGGARLASRDPRGSSGALPLVVLLPRNRPPRRAGHSKPARAGAARRSSPLGLQHRFPPPLWSLGCLSV